MARKKSTVLYDNHVEICEKYLSDAQFGRLIFALHKNDDPDFGDDAVLAMAYEFISLQKDLDDAKYEERCRKNRENGKRGGRPKKEDKKIEKANGFFKNPKDEDKDKEEDKDKDDGEDAGLSDDNQDAHDHDSHLLGSFQNVKLTDTELDALKGQYERVNALIEKVSIWLRTAKNDVPDHYALCVKFANNDSWPKRRVIDEAAPIVVEDPLDEEEQDRMVAQMRARVNGMFSSG